MVTALAMLAAIQGSNLRADPDFGKPMCPGNTVAFEPGSADLADDQDIVLNTWATELKDGFLRDGWLVSQPYALSGPDVGTRRLARAREKEITRRLKHLGTPTWKISFAPFDVGSDELHRELQNGFRTMHGMKQASWRREFAPGVFC